MTTIPDAAKTEELNLDEFSGSFTSIPPPPLPEPTPTQVVTPHPEVFAMVQLAFTTVQELEEEVSFFGDIVNSYSETSHLEACLDRSRILYQQLLVYYETLSSKDL